MMGNKNLPGRPAKKHGKQSGAEALEARRTERRERKHALKLLRRKAQRRGLIRPVTPEIK